MTLICPHCNSRLEIEQATEDASTRALWGLVGGRVTVGGPLVAYLGLFKPRLQSLRPSRALYLAGEVLALSDDDTRLAAALVETVEAMREKRQAESWRPLRNHQYLARVLESVAARGPLVSGAGHARAGGGQSRTAQAMALVEACPAPVDVPPEIAQAVRDGFQDFLRRSLEGVPAADVIQLIASTWMHDLAHARDWDTANLRRLAAGFRQVGAKADRWPKVADVLAFVPRIGQR